jgi:predicted nucleic acid-binding protein
MRDLFSWKLLPSETDFESLWNDATFVFDTNVLLDLYRVSRSTAKDYLDTLEKISDRIWLPYQVANEFLTRREEIINSEAASFKKALLELEKWKSEQENLKALRSCLTSDKTGRIVCDELKSLFEVQEEYISSVRKVEQAFRDKIEQLENDHTALNSGQDIILERLLDLFDSKVGEPFEQNILLDLHKEADERFKKLIPPGYMDNTQNKGDRKYGDFILWKQILIFAKKESQPIIFVTAEKKEDWWIRRNGEIVSPHEKLRQEFQEYVSQSFWMYRPQRFLEMATKKFMVDIDQKSIEEMSTIAEDEFYDEQDDEIVNQIDESLEDVLEGVRRLNSIQYENIKKAAMGINSSANPFAEYAKAIVEKGINSSANPFAEYAKAIFEKQIGENANFNPFAESSKAAEQIKAEMNSLSIPSTEQIKAIQRQINENTYRNPLA